MKKYNHFSGVPLFSYYLKEIISFADFEVEQEERILFTSRNKQELIDMCIKNNWSCREANTCLDNNWYTHYIGYRWV